VPRDSFFQNNFFLLPGLVEVVRDCLRRAGRASWRTSIAASGFSALSSRTWWGIRGVELDQTGGQGRRRNAEAGPQQRGISGRTAEDLLPGVMERFSAAAACVLLDPRAPGVCPTVWRCCAGCGPRKSSTSPVIPPPWRGLEHFVREVSLNCCASFRWTCFRRPRTLNAWRTCG